LGLNSCPKHYDSAAFLSKKMRVIPRAGIL
jgi:hypothetical protein